MVTPNDLHRQRDIPASMLRLPDGRRADALKLSALWAALTALKTPGIKPEMGKAALLGLYASQLMTLVNAMPRAVAEPWRSTVSEEVARRAIAQIGKDAAA